VKLVEVVTGEYNTQIDNWLEFTVKARILPVIHATQTRSLNCLPVLKS